ncbi:MAG: hypothetical protein ABF876_07065 [Acetobacter aceti]|uniref:hypothetical protein n=1 Tax=Acetobacter aceti TaxID=435 RepID=UPI001F1A5E37|nr:hypothetical protein [Acetobacter aceti]
MNATLLAPSLVFDSLTPPHFVTVFGLIPNASPSAASEACYRCSAARTACVVVALP